MSIKIHTDIINKKIQIYDIVIKFGFINDYDFIITKQHNNVDTSTLFKRTINTLFLAADKKYKVIYDDFIFTPSNFNDECGIIKNNIIKRHCVYKKNNNIGYCLYGKIKLYLEGAKMNVNQYKDYNNDLNCIFYTRKDIDNETKEHLQQNSDVIECAFMPGWFMMFTRFYPVENPNNNIYMSRDTDCRLNKREIYCNDEWLNSNKKLHIMRDHKYHTTEILGGLWGYKNGNIKNIRLLIAEWCMEFIKNKKLYQKGPDQFFLKNIYHLYKHDMFVHDEILNYEDDKYKIKVKRINNEYIGEAFDENNNILYPYLRNIK